MREIKMDDSNNLTDITKRPLTCNESMNVAYNLQQIKT